MKPLRAKPFRSRPSVEALEDRWVPASIAVTLATDPAASTPGTLRYAVLQVNAGKNDGITFNIAGTGVKTIALTSALPALTKPVTLDGTTQPGYASNGGKPLIALTRASSNVTGDGLLLTGGNSTVRGLAIYGFNGYGLHFQTGGGNRVAADFLGADATGAAAPGNGAGGVWLDHSGNNVVGGTTTTDRNLISGNQGDGVRADGGASGNAVLGDLVGTDLAGTKALPNLGYGVIFTGLTGTATNRVANSVIANNKLDGVFVITSANVVIQNNTITNNSTQGVDINASTNVTVGGTAAGTANTITNNGLPAASISSGVLIRERSSAVTVAGNTVNGNGARGVHVSNSSAVTVTANTMANNKLEGVLLDNAPSNVTLTGNKISGSGTDGVFLSGATNVTIQGNTVSGSNNRGVAMSGASAVTVAGNTLTGNGLNNPDAAGVVVRDGSFGVAVTGNTINGNGRGVRISGSGLTVPAGQTFSISLVANTISSNNTQGVFIDDAFGGTSRNVLLTGNTLVRNNAGISIFHGSNVTVGGPAAADRNKITGSNLDGVVIDGDPSKSALSDHVTVTNALISGNGIDGVRVAHGSTAVTVVGSSIRTNGYHGVDVGASSGVTVSGNVIDGNGTAAGASGVYVHDGSSDVAVAGNSLTRNSYHGVHVGNSGATVPAGKTFSITISGNTASSNALDGVLLDNFTGSGSSNVLVSGNTTTFNGKSGVALAGGTSKVSIVGNTIASNNLEGVDVSGSSAVTLGGTAAGAGNLVSNNGFGPTAGHGVYLRDGAANVTIQGNRLTGNAQQGVYAVNTSGIVVGGTAAGAGNTITANGFGGAYYYAGILLESSSNAQAVNNTVTGNGARGIHVAHATGVLVSGNFVTDNTTAGILVDSGFSSRANGPSNDVTVTNNTVIGNLKWGVRVADSGNVVPAGKTYSITVSGNTVVGNGDSAGVLVDDNDGAAAVLVGKPANVLVSGNTIRGNGGNGVRVESAAGNVRLDGNTIADNGSGAGPGSSGVYLRRGSNGVTLVGNLIVNSGGDGVRADGVMNLLLGLAGAAANDVENNEGNGVTLVNCTTVVLVGNTAANNGGDGVLVGTGCTKVTLPSGNTIFNNDGWGVEILSASVAAPDLTLNSLFGNDSGDVKK